jgi:hydrogenase maturation protease
MARLLIIGFGNPLRGDDGVGYRAAERLRDAIDDSDVEVIAAHQLLPEMMERVASAARVVLIDAGVGRKPGEIRDRPLDSSPRASRFTHELTAETLVAGARKLYGWTGEATLLSIAGREFTPGFALSRVVSDALETVLHRIAGQCTLRKNALQP